VSSSKLIAELTDFYYTVSTTEDCCVQKADNELTVVDKKMSKLDQLRLELADFFCEDAKTFRLDDCVKTFHEFFEKLNKAIQVRTLYPFTHVISM